jgi:hypothetical protein
MSRKGTPLYRFWRYVEKTSGCWNWTGHKFVSGYGSIQIALRKVRVHRFSYELHKGPIPKDLQLDHLCSNRLCVNPDHLEAVTARTNNMRGNSITAVNARKVACMHGHPLSGENLWVNPKTGWRACLACVRNRTRAYYKRKHPHAREFRSRWKSLEDSKCNLSSARHLSRTASFAATAEMQ